VGQSSSQHEKCQFGNMHTYSLDLVHFPIIPSSFTWSFNYPMYLLITITIYVPWLARIWTEEAGCHAHRILKRQVVKPVRILSLGERIVENCFPCALGNNFIALRLYVRPVAKDLEGKWDNQRTIE